MMRIVAEMEGRIIGLRRIGFNFSQKILNNKLTIPIEKHLVLNKVPTIIKR